MSICRVGVSIFLLNIYVYQFYLWSVQFFVSVIWLLQDIKSEKYKIFTKFFLTQMEPFSVEQIIENWHTHTYIYIYIYIFVYICKYIYICVCMCIYEYLDIYKYMFTFLSTYIYVCVCVCNFLSIYMYVYIYIHRKLFIYGYIYTYIYIQTVSFYQNSSVWLDPQDCFEAGIRNPSNFTID